MTRPVNPDRMPAAYVRYGQTGRVVAALSMACLLAPAWHTVRAEYADVVLNRRSDTEGVRPVIFPHWFHRIRYQCRVCHSELGFIMKAGANDVTMQEITDGRFCGACHNGQIAWSAENCDLCHSARPGTRPGIRGGHQTLGPGDW